MKKYRADGTEVPPWYLDKDTIQKIIILLTLVFSTIQTMLAKEEARDAKVQSQTNGAVVKEVVTKQEDTHLRLGKIQKDVEIQTSMMRPPFGVPEKKQP